jgi:tetratricopeptide (TPR) repeat protein
LDRRRAETIGYSTGILILPERCALAERFRVARYTENVARRILLLTLVMAAALLAQQDKPKTKSTDSAKPQAQEPAPPEEDENLKPREYPFNPLEAENDVKVGNFYFKQSKFKAAINRFREATRYNPTFAEAFLRLGDAETKMGDKQAASDAYQKYLELAPDAKNADAVKKKIIAKH